MPKSRISEPVLSQLVSLGVIVDGLQARPLERADLEHVIGQLGSAGLDLSGADMRGIDVRGMDLSGAVMRYCNLAGALGMPLVTDENGIALPANDPGYELALNGWYTGDLPAWVASVTPTVLDGVDLNLSMLSRADFRGASIRDATLTRAELMAADLSYVDLTGSALRWVKMDGAIFRLAKLVDADLERSRMMNVDLTHADLEDARLSGISFSQGTQFEMAGWDRDYVSVLERSGDLDEAVVLYRGLMTWYEAAGLRDVSSRFYYRMKEAERKAKWQLLKRRLRPMLLMQVAYLQCWRLVLGFGEYPYRILWFAPVLFVGTWIAYWHLGTFEGVGRASWHDALYYCFASFTALGYGQWSPTPTGWAKWVGAVQPFFGIFFALMLSVSVSRLFARAVGAR